MSNDDNFWADAEILSSYLVADAVADGSMRHVEEKIAREAGFKIPVVITSGAWENLVAWDGTDHGQSEEGRLWDVLYMTFLNARKAKAEEDSIDFTMGRVPAGSTRGTPSRVEVCAVVQAYDKSGAPCLTIFLPDER